MARFIRRLQRIKNLSDIEEYTTQTYACLKNHEIDGTVLETPSPDGRNGILKALIETVYGEYIPGTRAILVENALNRARMLNILLKGAYEIYEASGKSSDAYFDFFCCMGYVFACQLRDHGFTEAVGEARNIFMSISDKRG